VQWDRGEARMTAEQLAKYRLDTSWQEVVQLDSVVPGRTLPNPEKWEHINPARANGGPMHLPLTGEVAGPSVLRVQVLLDRARFSPGIMDGHWGKNTAEAVYWFQRAEGLRATAQVDSATFARLTERGGAPRELVRRHVLTADDVKGPFTPIPEDIYEQAKLECSCYESLSEKLSEMFHATPELLGQLNPGVDLNAVKAGDALHVPAVRDDERAKPRGQVAKLVVSGRGTYVHAVDARGRILYHFPSTLGGKYSPSPSGQFRVTAVARDPVWHYQPSRLTNIPDDEPEAMIPAGPNVAVGVVWIDLSVPHYGIHGTAVPETIGYTSSSGCVRLTNWDASFLASQVQAGTPVEFRDVPQQAGGQTQEAAAAEAATRRSTGETRTSQPRAEPSGPRSTEEAGPEPARRETPRPAAPARPRRDTAASRPAADTSHAGHEGHGTPRR
jgi:lipoprotein-anchoring transpeptidase ErfK/SrfK